MTNPFAVASASLPQHAIYGDARRVRGGFLYREIEFQAPYATRMVYSGWWFRQQITFDGLPVWFRISWLKILPRAEFTLPPSIAGEGCDGRIEIQFSRGLSIRRFRVWFNDEIAYDEVN